MRTEFTVTAIEVKRIRKTRNASTSEVLCLRPERSWYSKSNLPKRNTYLHLPNGNYCCQESVLQYMFTKWVQHSWCKHTGCCKKDDNLPPDKTPKQREGIASSKLSGILQVSTVTCQNLWVWLIQGDSSVQISLPVFSETILMKCLFTSQKLNTACRECLFCIYLSLVWKS